jgi:hypothetical protein
MIEVVFPGAVKLIRVGIILLDVYLGLVRLQQLVFWS